MRYYKLGWGDSRIGKKLNLDRNKVYRWRKKNNLESNSKSKKLTKIQKRRMSLGKTQQQIAIEINKITKGKVKLTQQAISNVENEKTSPPIIVAYAFAKILNSSVKELFYKEEWFSNV
ncbi:MAG: helix-turn-helix transcriptional regulator [Bacillota bacterium]